MDKLLIDLCRRLPFDVLGRMRENPEYGNLKLEGIDLSGPDPQVIVGIPGLKAPAKISLNSFQPFLKSGSKLERLDKDRAYQEGIDVFGLIESGEALEWNEMLGIISSDI